MGNGGGGGRGKRGRYQQEGGQNAMFNGPPINCKCFVYI